MWEKIKKNKEKKDIEKISVLSIKGLQTSVIDFCKQHSIENEEIQKKIQVIFQALKARRKNQNNFGAFSQGIYPYINSVTELTVIELMNPRNPYLTFIENYLKKAEKKYAEVVDDDSISETVLYDDKSNEETFSFQ